MHAKRDSTSDFIYSLFTGIKTWHKLKWGLSLK